MKIRDIEELQEIIKTTCVDRNDFSIGFEQSLFLAKKNTYIPLDIYEKNGIRDVLKYFHVKYDYAMLDKTNILKGIKDAKGNRIQVLQGGQIRLKIQPVYSPNAMTVTHNKFFQQLETCGKEMGFNIFCIGYQPFTTNDKMPSYYDAKYSSLKDSINIGTPHIDEMFQSFGSSSVQINYDNEQNMVRMFRICLTLLPIMRAIFANSSIIDKKITEYHSYQAHLWSYLQNKKEVYDIVFEPGFAFDKYLEYLVKIPMPYIVLDGEYVKINNQNFEDFMNGNLKDLSDIYPNQSDFFRVLSFVQSSVRIRKNSIEMAGIDSCSPIIMVALPTLLSSIMYTPMAMDKFEYYTRFWKHEDIYKLNEKIPTEGLEAKIGDRTIAEVGLDILLIAQEAAKKQGLHGEIFLSPVEEILKTGKTSAQNWTTLMKKHQLNFNDTAEDVQQDSNKYLIT